MTNSVSTINGIEVRNLKMKKMFLACILALALFATACSTNKTNMTESFDNIADAAMEAQSESLQQNENEESAEVEDELQNSENVETIEEVYGIVFLGYENGEAISEPYAYINDEQFKKMESVMHEGDEYYLIVPKNANTFIEIFDTDEQGNVGSWLYRSSVEQAVPVLLRCNVSDVYTNTSVRIQSGDTVVSFSPMVSLVDSNVVVGEGGYELQPLEQNLLNNDTQSLNDIYISTIRSTVGNEYIMDREFMRSDDLVIFGKNCAVFALGINSGGNFAVEEWFAVSEDNTVYYYNYNANDWLGWSAQE